jgi:hypothetical protein
MNEMKLFEVGFKEKLNSNSSYFSKVYVVAEDAIEAQEKVRQWLLKDAEDFEDYESYVQFIKNLVLARIQHIGIAVV